MSLHLGRRSFLASLGVTGASLFSGSRLFAAAATTAAGHTGGGNTGSMSSPGFLRVDGSPVVPIKTGLGSTGNPWAEIGVIPCVNTQGTVTVIGGSVMKPEVIELIRMGNMHFAVVDDLEMKAGEWLAKLCKQPEGHTGLIVNGAAHAAVIGYAGMMTEDYRERIGNIPDLRNFPKTEVIIQASHTGNFDHQIRQTGAKLVVVNNREEMIRAINPRTVAIHFLNIAADRPGVTGQVNGPDTVQIARQGGVYTFCDASADVPPKERLWEYPAVGFDMTTFSGGKDICGPQAAGLLFGKKELIRFALLNTSPQENTIGRPSKVGKETMFGLMKAVELFVNQDYAETLRKYDRRAQSITDALAPYGVTANPRQYNEQARGNVSPSYSWTWDADKIKLTSDVIRQKLSETKPVAIGAPGGGMGSGGLQGRSDPNWNGPYDSNGGRRPAPAGAPAPARGGGRVPAAPNTFGFSTWLLKDGEDKYIASRLVEIFNEAGVKKVASAKPAAKKA